MPYVAVFSLSTLGSIKLHDVACPTVERARRHRGGFVVMRTVFDRPVTQEEYDRITGVDSLARHIRYAICPCARRPV